MDKISNFTRPTERTMKIPYTLTAQIRQFPYKWMFQNQWIVRYWVYGCFCSLPVFMYISSLANSPANVKKWADAKAKEAAEEHHH